MPYIKLDNTKLFFDVYGSSLQLNSSNVEQKPTMIVLHGGHGFSDHSLYVKFWSRFSEIAQVIFLDQRGCGRSALASSAEWNLQRWAEDLFQFCETLSIAKPIIAGVSMGGHVMCEYVKRYSEHPGALIFCNTEAKFDLELVCDMFRKLGGDKIAELVKLNFTSPSPDIIEEFKLKCVPYYANNAYSKSDIERCLQRTHVFEHYCKHQMHHFNYLNDIHHIKCPTLLMVGEDSPGHPPKAAEQMAKKIDPKWLTYHEFKQCGAPVYNDAPAEAYQTVYDFIKHLS